MKTAVLLFAFCFHAHYHYGVQRDEGISFFEDGTYTLVKEEGNIAIFHRRTAQKGVISYKGSLWFPQMEAETLVAFLTDYEQHKDWVYNCLDSQLISQNGKKLLYQKCKSHWPYKKRDFSLRLKEGLLDNGDRTFLFISEPDAVPQKQKTVRIQDFKALWKIEPFKNGVQVSLYAHFDPQMSMPQFMLQSYATKIPWETLVHLEHRLGKQQNTMDRTR